jgi:hypothetical protein
MFSVCVALIFVPAQESRPILDRVPQLQATAQKAMSGEMGCGGGMLKLVTSRGVITAQTDLDPIHVFGHTVKTADLLALLKSRAESNRTGMRGPMSGGKVSNLCYVCLSALAVSKEPLAIPVLADLLMDEETTVRGMAAIALFRLGDADEVLRAAVRKVQFPKAALATARAWGEQPPAWLGK